MLKDKFYQVYLILMFRNLNLRDKKNEIISFLNLKSET